MYKLVKSSLQQTAGGVLRIIDNTFIPFDEKNMDYQEYKRWLAEGNEPLPPEEPVSP